MLDSEPLLWFTREFAARHPLAYPFGIPPAGRMLATAGAALEMDIPAAPCFNPVGI
ncbi:MAG: hypothetical protein RSA65_09590 [Clostridia bacterium]